MNLELVNEDVIWFVMGVLDIDMNEWNEWMNEWMNENAKILSAFENRLRAGFV